MGLDHRGGEFDPVLEISLAMTVHLSRRRLRRLRPLLAGEGSRLEPHRDVVGTAPLDPRQGPIGLDHQVDIVGREPLVLLVAECQ